MDKLTPRHLHCTLRDVLHFTMALPDRPALSLTGKADSKALSGVVRGSYEGYQSIVMRCMHLTAHIGFKLSTLGLTA